MMRIAHAITRANTSTLQAGHLADLDKPVANYLEKAWWRTSLLLAT
jgi:hypothetical protein